MKKSNFLVSSLLFVSMFSTSVLASNYCAGIRGNGELAPAHWSSLSRIVENKGMPEKMAGGSSAAITLFLMDGISRNKNLSSNPEVKSHEQALMLKSLVPHLLYLYEVDAKSPVIMKLVGNAMGITKGGFFSALKKAVRIAKDLPTFFEVLGEYGPLLNPDLAKGLRQNFSFYKGQLAEGLKVFGSFDAKGDMNIFYREGIVDFKYLAVLFGRIADFYAGYGKDAVNDNMAKFLSECSEVSVGKDWRQTLTAKPLCHKLFKDSLDSYYAAPTYTRWARRLNGKGRYQKTTVGKRTFPNKMIFSKVGSGLNAFPTTTVVIGDAEKRYTKLSKEYITKNAQGVEDYTIDFDTELKYGYWGDSSALSELGSNLKTMFPNDTKSKKFQALEGGVWFEVLGTSPAEPGLSKLTRIPDGRTLDPERILNKRYFASFLKFFPSLTAVSWFSEKFPENGISTFRKDMYSAGGWSDLHPTLVLKASGCDEVVYVTRQGGESVFGQQIFIRMSDYTDKISFWKTLNEGNRDGYTNLTSEEKNSPWNKLYNLGNPLSSYALSVKVADVVYCTDWDAYNLFKPGQLELAMTDSYNAPVFVKDQARRSDWDFGYETEGKSPDNFPGCLPKDYSQEVF